MPEDSELMLGQLANVLNCGCVTVLEFNQGDIFALTETTTVITTAVIVTTAIIAAITVVAASIASFIKASTVAISEL